MLVVAVALAVLAAVLVAFAFVTHFATRYVAEPIDAVVGECAGCGVDLTADTAHTITETATDDHRYGIVEGGTGMSVDYCAEHCPGGCVTEQRAAA